jgi:hypothetical protein
MRCSLVIPPRWSGNTGEFETEFPGHGCRRYRSRNSIRPAPYAEVDACHDILRTRKVRDNLNCPAGPKGPEAS